MYSVSGQVYKWHNSQLHFVLLDGFIDYEG